MTVEQLKHEVAKWSPWWVGMWYAIVVVLLTTAFFLEFYHWWTAAAVLFGIPEVIGVWKDDDAFPPLTHVIVRFIDWEIAFPFIYGFYGAVGAYWFGFRDPSRLGLFAALLGWLDAHFTRRYYRK